MNEQEIIQANLKAQIIIEDARVKALSGWVMNTNCIIQAEAGRKIIELLKEALKKHK